MTVLACKCMTWGNDRLRSLIDIHHHNCPKRDVEASAIALIGDLIKGMESWAQDEDGIHPDAWNAYQRAKSALMQPIVFEVA